MKQNTCTIHSRNTCTVHVLWSYLCSKYTCIARHEMTDKELIDWGCPECEGNPARLSCISCKGARLRLPILRAAAARLGVVGRAAH